MTENVYQLKITACEIEPPIWRRLLIPANANLAMLHAIIQVTMGWVDYHLYEFRIGGEAFQAPDPEAQGKDSSRAKLNELGLVEGQHFEYTYDFGDDWELDVLVERDLPREPDREYPGCTDGARAGPPEDCGGAPGYAELMRALANPDDPAFAELIDWVDPVFDPEEFDAKMFDKVLQVAFGRGAV